MSDLRREPVQRFPLEKERGGRRDGRPGDSGAPAAGSQQADRFQLSELDSIYQTAPVGLCVFDTELRFVRVNKRLAEINGVPAADHIGRTPREVVPHLADVAERLFRQVLETGKPIRNLEIVGETPAEPGITRTWLEHFYPLFDENGEVVGINVTVEEITQRKQMEQALRSSEAKLRELNRTLEERVAERTEALARSSEALLEARDRFFTLFHASPVPTNLTSLHDGTILDANAAYITLFNVPREEIVGRKSSELARLMKARAAEREKIRALIEQTGRAANVEMHLSNGTGEERVMLVSVETTALDGQPVAVSTLIDVTERAQTREQVRELAAALSRAEEQVRKRIAQVLHDDIQQMLVALKLESELGLAGGEESVREGLRSAVDYSDEIIEKVRDLSMELSLPALEDDRLVEALAWIRTFMDERYGLDVQLQVPQEVEIANPDLHTLVLRLVRELLFNVVKHAGTNQARVQVDLDPEALVVQVIDDGCGFDPAVLEDPSSATGFGLTGMGHRLELFGGRFEVASTRGEGTRVTLLLPKEQLNQPG